jgi:hypothetical protein
MANARAPCRVRTASAPPWKECAGLARTFTHHATAPRGTWKSTLWKGLGGAPAPSPRCGVVRQGFGQYGIKVSFWGAAPGAGHPDDPGTDPDLITLTLTLTTVPNPNPNTLTPGAGYPYEEVTQAVVA